MLLRTIIICVLLTGVLPARAATHEYTVWLDAELTTLRVAGRLADGSTRSYDVDLDSIDQHRAGNAQTIVVPINQWMRRPRLGGADEVIISFQLPDDIRVSVPWQPLDQDGRRYRLVSSPQSGTGLAVFGRFDEVFVPVADVQMRVASVPSDSDSIPEEMIEWTRQTAENVALAYGRFPNSHARVLLFPARSWWSDSAVLFGRVVRDGGETVELLVDPGGSEERFLGDWTATHEFTHLMLPYVTRSQRWVSEGFAQYYQNVLLARAGHHTAEEAWEKIRSGLEQGRQSSPQLSPNQAARDGIRNSRMKIYWSGAALAMMADIELRYRSGGALSLDVALDRLEACCLPSRRTWSGRELFEQLDKLIDGDRFVALYDRYADVPGFPDYEKYLEGPEFADIRAAIMARRYTRELGRQ
jgi:hypothetical protein